MKQSELLTPEAEDIAHCDHHMKLLKDYAIWSRLCLLAKNALYFLQWLMPKAVPREKRASADVSSDTDCSQFLEIVVDFWPLRPACTTP